MKMKEYKESRWRDLLYNSVTVNLPKNMIQFSLGAVLFWFTFGGFRPVLFAVSLVGFLLTYFSVYLLNDIVDYKEDKKDPEKSKWKLIATGKLSIENATSLHVLFLVSGIVISLFVGRWFTLILLGMVFLNFLHSSNFIKFKKSVPKTAVNMTAIEFLKYSAGWFAFTSDLSRFPFWLLLCFSVAYVGIYMCYKFKFNRKLISTNRAVFIIIGIVFVASYGISFVAYSFSLPLVLMFLFVAVLAVFMKYFRVLEYKMKKLFIVEYMVLIIVIICFLLLANPSLARLNENLTDIVGNYKDAAINIIPSEIANGVRMDGYENLEDIERAIKNLTLLNLTRP